MKKLFLTLCLTIPFLLACSDGKESKDCWVIHTEILRGDCPYIASYIKCDYPEDLLIKEIEEANEKYKWDYDMGLSECLYRLTYIKKDF